MPLLPTGERHRITIDGDWYDLPKALSIVAYSDLSAAMSDYVVALQAFKDALERGDQDAIRHARHDQLIKQMATIEMLLMGWSHEDAITLENITRMPQSHIKEVTNAIGVLLKNAQFTDDSDLGKESGALSELNNTPMYENENDSVLTT